MGAATRVMSLRDGAKKMSKSDPSDMSRIKMTDSADEIQKKIRKATTDPELLPGPGVLDEAGQLPEEVRKGRPEAFNLLNIYAALANQSLTEVLGNFEGKGFGDFKKAMVDLAVSELGPIGDEVSRLMDDHAAVDGVLRDGAERANALAEPILGEVKKTVGFLKP